MTPKAGLKIRFHAPVSSHPFAVLILFLIAAALAGCGKPSDPEQQIRDWVKRGEEAVTAREIMALAELVADDYQDERGQTKKDALRMAGAFILHNKQIYLLTKVSKIEFPDPNTAKLTLFVAMAGQPFAEGETLFSLRTDINRFEFTLRREGDEWLATSAKWRQASHTDLID